MTRVTDKERIQMMGQRVIAEYKVERWVTDNEKKRGVADVDWKPEKLTSPLKGWCVGFRVVFKGQIWPESGRNDPGEYEPPHFSAERGYTVMLVAPHPNQKPVRVPIGPDWPEEVQPKGGLLYGS